MWGCVCAPLRHRRRWKNCSRESERPGGIFTQAAFVSACFAVTTSGIVWGTPAQWVRLRVVRLAVRRVNHGQWRASSVPFQAISGRLVQRRVRCYYDLTTVRWLGSLKWRECLKRNAGRRAAELLKRSSEGIVVSQKSSSCRIVLASLQSLIRLQLYTVAVNELTGDNWSLQRCLRMGPLGFVFKSQSPLPPLPSLSTPRFSTAAVATNRKSDLHCGCYYCDCSHCSVGGGGRGQRL